MSIDATRWAWSQQEIKSTDKLVLLSLADRAGEDHECYPSSERLALDTCLNLKTVKTAIKRLKELGLVEDTGRRRGQSGRVVVYRLIGVNGRENQSTQKRVEPKNGIDPNLDGNRPKNGSTESTQKRVAESTNRNLPRTGKDKSAPATTYPTGFSVTDDHKKLAQSLGCPNTEVLKLVVDEFRDYCKQEGATAKDWNAKFANWIRRVPKFGGWPTLGGVAAKPTAMSERDRVRARLDDITDTNW